MLQFPEIDPVALQLGPLKIHWYGLMYLVGFLTTYLLVRYRVSRQKDSVWNNDMLGDLLFYCVLGVILGGRTGYILFYNFSAFISDPIMLFRVWEGGMSFHGGLIGVTLATVLYGRKVNIGFVSITDMIAPAIALALGFGRLGNFINGELWGRVSDVPWAIIFPTGGPLARHPSQLYQAALEGFLLFAILWIYSSKPRPKMAVSSLFLIGYGIFRFVVEFFREPDAHLGYIAFGWLTNGQLLTIPMVIIGISLMVIAYSKAQPDIKPSTKSKTKKAK